MFDMRPVGKLLILAGMVFLLLGGIFLLHPKWPSWIGHLPGDIWIRKKNFSFYFPVTTCLAASALASLIVWLLSRK